MGTELTGRLTVTILRERRSATMVLPPAIIRTGVLGTGLGGATMSVHDAM